MNTAIVLSAILFAATFMLSVWAWMTKKMAERKLRYAEIIKEATEESMRHYDALLDRLPRTCYVPKRFDIEDNGFNIAVRGHYLTGNDAEYPVAIKFFRYDDGDKEYALLAANELLEHLTEKP